MAQMNPITKLNDDNSVVFSKMSSNYVVLAFIQTLSFLSLLSPDNSFYTE